METRYSYISAAAVLPDKCCTYLHAGGDGVQIYTNKVYGTLACGLKLTDAPEGLQAKNITWSPVCVVQGPTEPGSYHDVMGPILEFFEKHDPGVTLAILPFTPHQVPAQHRGFRTGRNSRHESPQAAQGPHRSGSMWVVQGF